jgi:flagellar hook-associated protein 2
MGVSSLGMGSNVLTQDVLDQLYDADKLSRVTPIDKNILLERQKRDSLELIDATMKNLTDSIDELNSHTLYTQRSIDVTGSSVDIEADLNTDEQEFTLEVTQLATKQVEESGSFSAKTDTIANSSGNINLNIDGEDFEIAYDSTTTLDDLRKSINSTAGDKVNATIVKLGDNDYRLFLSSVETGTNQDITITDKNIPTNLKDTKLTNDLTAIQEAVNSKFKINSQEVERQSNSVDDLITGVHITLKELGSSNVKISQDSESILKRVDSFVEKYNAAISQLNTMTKASMDEDERGVFSSESTIKSMKRMLTNLLDSVGDGVASMSDYGFDIDKNGVLSVNKTTLESKLEDNADNFEAFFAGGTYVQDISGGFFQQGSTSSKEVTGIFNEMATKVEEYTKYNATLDQYQTSINENITILEKRKTTELERLESKYEIIKKQFAAYDIMISKLNSASSMFTQMAEAQKAASKN